MLDSLIHIDPKNSQIVETYYISTTRPSPDSQSQLSRSFYMVVRPEGMPDKILDVTGNERIPISDSEWKRRQILGEKIEYSRKSTFLFDK